MNEILENRKNEDALSKGKTPMEALLENNEIDKNAWRAREKQIRKKILSIIAIGLILIILCIFFRKYILAFVMGAIDVLASIVTIVEYIEKRQEE